jgi:hypothetical protein
VRAGEGARPYKIKPPGFQLKTGRLVFYYRFIFYAVSIFMFLNTSIAN